MFRQNHSRRQICLSALVLLASTLVSHAAEAAGTVGYRNETSQTVIVQSSVTVNGVTRRGRAIALAPGESAIDAVNGIGTRRISVYDPKKLNTPLYQGDVNVTEDTLLTIRPEVAPGTTMVKTPAPMTRVKLLATKLQLPSTPAPPPGSPVLPKSKK